MLTRTIAQVITLDGGDPDSPLGRRTPFRADLPAAVWQTDASHLVHRIRFGIDGGVQLEERLETGCLLRVSRYGCMGLYIPSSAFTDEWNFIVQHACDEREHSVRLRRNGDWLRAICSRSEHGSLSIFNFGRCELAPDARVPRDFFYLNEPVWTLESRAS